MIDENARFLYVFIHPLYIYFVKYSCKYKPWVLPSVLKLNDINLCNRLNTKLII